MKIKKKGSCTDYSSYLKERYDTSFNELESAISKTYKVPPLEKLANRLHEIARESKKVCIVGDYDCDGVCSVINMALILQSLHIPYTLIVPRRMSEGYGLNEKVAERVIEAKCQVVITIDNGITAVEQIKRLKEYKMEVYIIDHHQKTSELPPADIIVDPTTIEDGSDYKYYCGAGLSYKLAQIVVKQKNVLSQIHCLACIATIGDLVPLTGDNRKIVAEGLALISSSPQLLPGVAILLEKMGYDSFKEADFFSFQIVPCINGMGRMEDMGAQYVVSALYSFNNANDKIDNLILANEARKEIVEEAMNKFNEELFVNSSYILYLASGVNEGILGIIAGKLADKYNKPTIVISEAQNGLYKGSARNCDDSELYLVSEEHNGILTQCADLLEAYGGHKDAAGLSLKRAKLGELKRRLDSIMPEREDDDNLYYDFELPFNQIQNYLSERVLAGPFGEGNREPIILMKDVPIQFTDRIGMQLVGKTKEHIKIPFKNGLSAICFFASDKYKPDAKKISMVGTLKPHHFNGVITPQFNIVDFDAE